MSTLGLIALLVGAGRQHGLPAQAGIPASFIVNTTDDHPGHQPDPFLSLREAVALATGDLAVIDLTEGECAQVSASSYPDACDTSHLAGAPYPNTITFDPAVFAAVNDPVIASVATFALDTDGTVVDGSNATVIIDGEPSFDCFTISGSQNALTGLTTAGCRNGIAIPDGSANTVAGSTIVNNSEHGVFAGPESSAGAFTDNYVGATSSGAEAGNGLSGLLIAGSDGNAVLRNVFAHNGSAATASLGPPAADNSGITIESGVANNIEANVFRDNAGLAIDLGGDGVTENDGGDGDGGANLGQNFPTVTAAVAQSPFRVDGFLDSRAGFAYRLDFYENDSCDPSGFGEGSRFLASNEIVTNTSPSAFMEFVSFGVTPGNFLTMTATNLLTNNTSEMSQCFAIADPAATPTPAPTPSPVPTPTPTPAPSHIQGDIDCDGDVDAIDVLKLLAYVAGLPFAQQPACPAIETAAAGGQIFGDADCDGDVDAVDALQILRHIAGLSPIQGPFCPAIGQMLRYGLSG